MRRRAWLCLLLATVLAAGVVGVQRAQIAVPPQWNPWSTLSVAARPNFLTRFKLARLDGDAQACREVLAQTTLAHVGLPDRETGPGCGFANAVEVQALPAEVGESFALSCRTAVTLALWERHVVQPAAREHLGAEVARFEHFGSYACRNVYGRPDATRSRHATAEAWDVAGFVLADGRRVRVVRDWQGTGPEALFLHAVARGGCRFFDAVLSPDYNQAHRDHLHLDRGPYRICR